MIDDGGHQKLDREYFIELESFMQVDPSEAVEKIQDDVIPEDGPHPSQILDEDGGSEKSEYGDGVHFLLPVQE